MILAANCSAFMLVLLVTFRSLKMAQADMPG